MRTADQLHEARALLLRINDAGQQLLDVYTDLYTALNKLYADHPRVYAEIQRTVKLPTNDDADAVTSLNRDLSAALQLLSDDAFLATLLDDDHLQTEVGDDDRA